MRENSTIKIWIQDLDLNCITENKKPSKFWLTRPAYLQNLVELTIPFSTLLEWDRTPSKILLKD